MKKLYSYFYWNVYIKYIIVPIIWRVGFYQFRKPKQKFKDWKAEWLKNHP